MHTNGDLRVPGPLLLSEGLGCRVPGLGSEVIIGFAGFRDHVESSNPYISISRKSPSA